MNANRSENSMYQPHQRIGNHNLFSIGDASLTVATTDQSATLYLDSKYDIHHNTNHCEDGIKCSISHDNITMGNGSTGSKQNFVHSSGGTSSSSNRNRSRKEYYEKQDSIDEIEEVKLAPIESSINIEIMPGVEVPLRSADETHEAIRNHFYIPATCFGCASELFCILDAKYLICPDCRSVNPLPEENYSSNSYNKRGIGMGFKCEDIILLQDDQ